MSNKFTGGSSQYDFMVPMGPLAKRNNAKPKIVTRRKLEKESDSRIFLRGI